MFGKAKAGTSELPNRQTLFQPNALWVGQASLDQREHYRNYAGGTGRNSWSTLEHISWKTTGFCHLSPVSPLLFGDPFLSPSSSTTADIPTPQLREVVTAAEQGQVPGTFPHLPHSHGQCLLNLCPLSQIATNRSLNSSPGCWMDKINNLSAITSVSDIYSLGPLIQELNNACMAFKPHKCNLELNSVINSTLPVKCILNLLHLSLHLVLKRKKMGQAYYPSKLAQEL